MRRKRSVAILISLTLVLLVVMIVHAQGLLDLSWWTADAGGGASQSASGQYVLNGGIGQPDAAASQGGEYALAGGFWSGGGKSLWKTFLPITMKQY